MGRTRLIRKRRQNLRRSKLSVLLTPTSTSDSVTTPPPSLFNLENMVGVCRENWTRWLSQVTAARMEQVTALSRTPSIEKIELLLNLEKLGEQLKQVGKLIKFI